MSRKPYLTPQQVAELLMVSPVTVRQWAQRGEIDALTTPGGHRRFTLEAVKAFARKRGMRLNPERSDDVMRILVVDDDVELNAWLSEMLSAHDVATEIASAHNGFDAGVKLVSFKPHLILLDLMMPGLDGFDVCSSVREDPTKESTRVIAMTGYPSDENVQRILEAGAETCLAKPLDFDRLQEVVFSRAQRPVI
ncbi:MAG: response regulator [Pseudomonadota bacterium]|nr:MAG: response regulator [Pseudomonadota bacterium]